MILWIGLTTLLDIPEFSSEEGSMYFFLQGILPGVKKFIESNKDLKEKDFQCQMRLRKSQSSHRDSTINSGATEAENCDSEGADEDEDSIHTLAESLNTLFRRCKRRFQKRYRTQKPQYAGKKTTDKGKPTNKMELRCFRCGRLGHMRAQCRIPQDLINALEEYDNGQDEPEELEEPPQETEMAYMMELTNPLNC